MQHTSLGDAEAEAYIRVDRASGTAEFYYVKNGIQRSISETEYLAAHQEG